MDLGSHMLSALNPRVILEGFYLSGDQRWINCAKEIKVSSRGWSGVLVFMSKSCLLSSQSRLSRASGQGKIQEAISGIVEQIGKDVEGHAPRVESREKSRLIPK